MVRVTGPPVTHNELPTSLESLHATRPGTAAYVVDGSSATALEHGTPTPTMKGAAPAKSLFGVVESTRPQKR
jgi:hypothetical protein